MKVKKWLCIVLVVLSLVLTGCGAASTDDMVTNEYFGAESDKLYDSVVMETSAAADMEGSTETNSGAPTQRKWIVTINLRAETEDLDTLLANLNQRIAELGGYVENSNIYNGSAYNNSRRYRNASLTLRIPAEQADQFTEQVAQASNVISSNKTMDDITLNYVSVESRMKALQVEEERLLELLAKAENMSDLLEIEARLTDVRYELERVTSQLRVYDNQVDYATIYLDISEVKEYTVVEEQTVWQRIGTGFVESLKSVGNFFVEIFVFLLANLPVLVLVAAAVWLTVFLIHRWAGKRRERYQPPRPPYDSPAPGQNNPPTT